MHPVQRPGDALLLGFSVTRINQDHRIDSVFSQAGSISVINYGAARKNHAKVIRRHGNSQILPVKQVRADGMTPVHRTPDRFRRIMLGEKMPCTVFIQQPIGIIDPAGGRRIVEGGTEIPVSLGAHNS